MNILDENTPEGQRLLLTRKRVRVRQIGYDIGRDGMKDDAIIPLLHHLDRPTFFTRDAGFYDRHLCHDGYCLVHLHVGERKMAEYVRRVLRHQELNAKVKRMGAVVQASPTGLSFWRLREQKEIQAEWQ
jgi:hypothetical protein